MFSLVRTGPKILIVTSQQIESFTGLLVNVFSGVESTFENAIISAKEGYTIVLLTSKSEVTLTFEDIETVIYIREDADSLLCQLFSPEYQPLIEKVRLAPRLLILRAVGDMDLTLSQLQKDIGGSVDEFFEILRTGNSETTVVALTDKALNRTLSPLDINKTALRLEGRYFSFYKALKMHALKCLNAGIGNRDWNEIEIRIFDRYSAYELHYNRLIELFESLELGLVLGESWSKDYPRLFMSVEVYRIRFFTFHPPKSIKRLLLGLEYLADGTRIVDYDVYFKSKKIDWTEVAEKDEPAVRHLIGLKMRADIFDKMSASDAEALKELETAVIKTRID